ncbi:MAG: nitrophenyl compound nitroreductase subunit ArsF family protein [Candidatus Moraniibacteriota bacterium]
MKKNLNKILYGIILLVAVFFIGTIYSDNYLVADQNVKENSKVSEKQISKPAEKVQVFLFHSTNRCSSCITAGKYTSEAMEQNFPEELKSGKIEFREINVDLPENKEVANKFKASGTSLFINPIIDGQDNIKEEMQAWRLLSDKQGFITHLSNKIKALI